MIRLLLFLGAIFLPASALAETVRVRSGDHAGFARLLLEFRDGPEWRFGRVAGGFEFRPARGDVDYDLSAVFDLIGRSRIAAVEDRGQGRLFVQVDCACHGDAFDLRNGMVVVDIKDGPATASARVFDGWLAEAEGVATPDIAAGAPAEDAPGEAAEASPREARRGLPLSLPPADPRAAAAAAWPSSAATGPIVPRSPSAEVPPGAGRDDALSARPGVDETQAELLRQVARAAAQGLLEADMTEIAREAARAVAAGADPPAPADPPPPDPPVPPVLPNGHVAMETGVDRAVARGEPRGGETDDGTACLDPEIFSLGPVTEAAEAVAELGALRGGLVGEFDRPDPAGLNRLVRAYLFLGFGAEAGALVRAYPDLVEHVEVVTTMAAILDLAASGENPAWIEQMACDGATALWAVLAQPRLETGASVNAPAVVATFSMLPAHLRRHLGPGLAARFLAIGDHGSADAIGKAIERVSEAADPALEVLTANLDRATGETERAASAFDRVVSGGSASGPEALLALVETTLDSGAAVAPDRIALLASYAYERRGTAGAGPFVDAEIRARAAGSDFTTSFALLAAAQAEGVLADARAAELSETVFGRLVQSGADATFLRETLPRLDGAGALPAEPRRAIAARLLELGFVGQALDVLGGHGALPDPADRVLFARAALLDRRPEVAVGYLAGLAGPEATQLRADALSMAGDHAGAARILAEAGKAEASDREAWRGSAWDVLASGGTGPMHDAARLMLGPAAPGSGPAPGPSGEADGLAEAGGPLALADGVLARSRETRAVLDLLLASLPAERASTP